MRIFGLLTPTEVIIGGVVSTSVEVLTRWEDTGRPTARMEVAFSAKMQAPASWAGAHSPHDVLEAQVSGILGHSVEGPFGPSFGS